MYKLVTWDIKIFGAQKNSSRNELENFVTQQIDYTVTMHLLPERQNLRKSRFKLKKLYNDRKYHFLEVV